MPELPEVKTIRLGLQRYVVGKTIGDVEVRLKKIVSGDSKDRVLRYFLLKYATM